MITLLHMGLGPVGCNIARRVQDVAGLKSVAAVDIRPDLQGRDLGEVLGLTKRLGCRVKDKVARGKAKVALHSTRSWLKDIESELETLIRAKLNVVSTAEELVFPIGKNAPIAQRLDRLAKRNRVTVVATGVNPGFVLDLLPVSFGRLCTKIQHVHALRLVDLSTRRMQLQKKVGVGLSPEAFAQETKSFRFGHQGMRESLEFVAKGLGIALRRTYLSIEPVLSASALSTEYFAIAPGQVCGLHQQAIGYATGGERIRLEVTMRVGAEAKDEIRIQADPPIHAFIPGGVAGEPATAAAVLNLISRVVDHEPGFYTLLTL